MEIKGIRFCEVHSQSAPLRDILKTAGFSPRSDVSGGDIFPTRENSWIELWDETPGMPAGIMLQILVDDVDIWAAQAKERGLELAGPFDQHNERMFMFSTPTGFQITVQSEIPDVT